MTIIANLQVLYILAVTDLILTNFVKIQSMSEDKDPYPNDIRSCDICPGENHLSLRITVYISCFDTILSEFQ